MTFRKTAAAKLDVRDIKKLKVADFVPYHNEKTLDRKLPRPFPGWGKKSFGTACSVLQTQIRCRSGRSDARFDSRRGFPYDSYHPLIYSGRTETENETFIRFLPQVWTSP
ncbi:MAG: hypothetical protein ABF292_12610 [Desulfobacterales bacterium]